MLRLDAAGWRAGRTPVVTGITVAVPPGRLLAILGPNGAGKTTTLGLLAGDLRPDGGAATLDGRSLQAIGPAALALRRAVMRQAARLAFAFTVEEVVAMGRAPHDGRVAAAAHRAAIAAALAEADIAHLADRRYPTLSGGERQRVQFARALAQLDLGAAEADRTPSRYLLLDEPTANLDLRHQHQLLAHARRLARRGLGVVAVLHDLNLAAAFADDVLLLSAGRVAGWGPAAEILTPAILEPVFRIALRRVALPEGGSWLVAAP